jgi:hypothetical protein
MDSIDFDEVDLNYILSAVSYYKSKIETMDSSWFSGPEVTSEYVRALSDIEEKICAQLDGDRQ